VTDDPQELITIEEAVRRLSLSRTVVYRLMDQGELRFMRMGRARRILASSVSDFVRKYADGEVPGRAGR
jgi:excisionase family DNA binding protein